MSCFRICAKAGWMIRVCVFLASMAFQGIAADTVDVTFPGSIYFAVGNVNRDGTASPNPVMIRFVNAKIGVGRVIRISVRAASEGMRQPSGRPIPIGKIAWTATAASGGTGFAGFLRTATYTPVFQSAPNPKSGGADLSFVLSSPGLVRAGAHTVNLEWKIEAVLN